MSEHSPIDLATEREKRRNLNGISALAERRRKLNSYYIHIARARALAESLGLPKKPREDEMARLAMRVCDLILDSRDETDQEVVREMVSESGSALGAYEFLREKEER